jgi:hypothetical protein
LAKEIINAYSLAFFDCYLKAEREAEEFLRQTAYPEEVELLQDGPRQKRL